MTQHDHRSLTRVLLEDPDTVNRSRAHLELGRRAAERDEPTRAVQHFREAALLDPTDEQPITALRELGAPLETMPPPPRRTWWPGSWLGR